MKGYIMTRYSIISQHNNDNVLKQIALDIHNAQPKPTQQQSPTKHTAIDNLMREIDQ